jgi:hypothetical protein
LNAAFGQRLNAPINAMIAKPPAKNELDFCVLECAHIALLQLAIEIFLVGVV